MVSADYTSDDRARRAFRTRKYREACDKVRGNEWYKIPKLETLEAHSRDLYDGFFINLSLEDMRPRAAHNKEKGNRWRFLAALNTDHPRAWEDGRVDQRIINREDQDGGGLGRPSPPRHP